jgi:hypothetical protein
VYVMSDVYLQYVEGPSHLVGTDFFTLYMLAGQAGLCAVSAFSFTVQSSVR